MLFDWATVVDADIVVDATVVLACMLEEYQRYIAAKAIIITITAIAARSILLVFGVWFCSGMDITLLNLAEVGELVWP